MPVGGGGGDSECLSSLRTGQSGEETKLDELCLVGVAFFKFGQRLIEAEQPLRFLSRRMLQLLEFHTLQITAPFWPT